MSSEPDIPSYKPVPKEELPFRETLIDQAGLSECDRLDLQYLGSLQGDTAHVVFISYPDCAVIAVDAKIKDLPFLKEVYDNDPVVGGCLQTYLPESIYNKVIKAIEDMQMRSLIREFVFAWDNGTFYSLTISTNSIKDYSTIGIEIEILDEMDLLDITSERSTLDSALKDIGRALDLCVDGREAAKVACDAIFKMVDKFDRGMGKCETYCVFVKRLVHRLQRFAVRCRAVLILAATTLLQSICFTMTFRARSFTKSESPTWNRHTTVCISPMPTFLRVPVFSTSKMS